MNNISITDREAADVLLSALGEQLASRGARYELIVVGGSALLALGLIDRPTRDVDVLALHHGGLIRSAKPLPPDLAEARDQVARDFRLPRSWLNDGPADLVDLGLPPGFIERVQRRDSRRASIRCASSHTQPWTRVLAGTSPTCAP
jgi:Nucleotidyltransferase of unknown function (DUF6036)